MVTDLERNEAQWLLAVARDELRRQAKRLARAAPRPGQSPDAFADVVKHMTEQTEFKQRVVDKLAAVADEDDAY